MDFVLIAILENHHLIFKNINYVLWSELWANNIDLNQYKIKYFPKILNAKEKIYH